MRDDGWRKIPDEDFTRVWALAVHLLPASGKVTSDQIRDALVTAFAGYSATMRSLKASPLLAIAPDDGSITEVQMRPDGPVMRVHPPSRGPRASG